MGMDQLGGVLIDLVRTFYFNGDEEPKDSE